eukprot:CAMPEP_0194356292 /NCGR_PEP_ID=MMETSP0174-20130528/3995_1 /TAXON_ID=216777 /ORGANISM="Proboscia alata, Strain PI-D3" /LENGTH=969 /DNA_ID=CAMNT_0039125843 /DNA_START=231 /DNA_END=3140 /DNA_ORIENTATION=+
MDEPIKDKESRPAEEKRNVRKRKIDNEVGSTGDDIMPNNELSDEKVTSEANVSAPRSNLKRWDGMFEQLEQYHNETGNTTIPHKYENNPKLGNWVVRQRKEYLAWKLDDSYNKDTITVSRLQKLESLGLVWDEKRVIDDKYCDDGNFTSTPRKSPHNRPRKSDDDNTEIKDSKSSDDIWDGFYQELELYKEEHGNVIVPVIYPKNRRLGLWVNRQRKQYVANKRGKQSVKAWPRRQKALELLEFVWEVKNKRTNGHKQAVFSRYKVQMEREDPNWSDRFKELEEFYIKNKNHSVPLTNPLLYEWVTEQRECYDKGEMAPKRVKLLNGINLPWTKNTKFLGTVNLGMIEGTGNLEKNLALASSNLHSTNSNEVSEEKPCLAIEITSMRKGSRPIYKRWDDMFHELEVYYEENGHSMVPSNYPKDIKLANWVARQRKEYVGWKRHSGYSTMTESRFQKLESINFVWDSKAKLSLDGEGMRRDGKHQNTKWDSMFEQLESYTMKNGNTMVPHKHMQNPKLGHWVARQRKEYMAWKRSKYTTMTEYRFEKLDSIGFVWDAKCGPRMSSLNCSDSEENCVQNDLKQISTTMQQEKEKNYRIQSAWDEMFRELKLYQKEHGDTLVPSVYSKSQKLGYWVNRQRRIYAAWQRGDATMHASRVEALESIGFVWELSQSSSDCARQPSHITRSKQIDSDSTDGCDIDTDESLEETVSATEECPNTFKEGRYKYHRWDDMFHQLKLYYEEHGNTMVPHKCAKNPKLGFWVSRQRKEYLAWKRKAGYTNMTEWRFKKLESISFVWVCQNPSMSQNRSGSYRRKTKISQEDKYDATWAVSFDHLVAYKEEHGDTMVPQTYAINQKLGNWVARQRREYSSLKYASKSSSMKKSRIKALESIGFVWSLNRENATKVKISNHPVRNSAVENDRRTSLNNFKNLEEFQKMNGYYLVPRNFMPDLQHKSRVSNGSGRFVLDEVVSL